MAGGPMIAGIHGRLEAHGADWVIVDVGGVSLRVVVPATSIARLPALGEPVRFLTHLYLREDIIALYGFLAADDQALFEQLIGVTGVGPKVAMTMLSSAPTASLRQAIASENVDNLTRIPGIGKKLAARLILELRGKLTAPEGAVVAPIATADSDVVDALLGLGYSLADAQSALRNLPSDRALDLEERIRLALQSFARR
jgi:Holliday junction DNA helicase RuvA